VITAPGFEPRRLPADLAESGVITAGLEWASGGGGGGSLLIPLDTRGGFFQLQNGEYWTAIEATDFRLFQRALNGEDITPVLQQRKQIGFNLLRVSLMCQQMFSLNPITYTMSQLAEFILLVNSWGLRLELVCFMDATLVMPDLTSQQKFFERVCSTVKQTGNTCLIELVNENDQPINTINTDPYEENGPCLIAHGSNGSQAVPVRPPWDYETFHTNDAFEWQRKVGHNAMELSDGAEGLPASHVPVIANENTRFPDRCSSLTMAYDAAAGAALLCAGSCFHSVSGKDSVLWSGVELACAEQWVAGARSVPLQYQDGAYRHATELETPGVLRAYQRVLPGGDAHTVQIRS
jgi:hypothetical protein